MYNSCNEKTDGIRRKQKGEGKEIWRRKRRTTAQKKRATGGSSSPAYVNFLVFPKMKDKTFIEHSRSVAWEHSWDEWAHVTVVKPIKIISAWLSMKML